MESFCEAKKVPKVTSLISYVSSQKTFFLSFTWFFCSNRNKKTDRTHSGVLGKVFSFYYNKPFRVEKDKEPTIVAQNFGVLSFAPFRTLFTFFELYGVKPNANFLASPKKCAKKSFFLKKKREKIFFQKQISSR
jgi:hypothetical protein